MHDEDDLRAVKFLAVFALLFVISLFMTWKQFKYWAFAEQATATVTQVFETTERGRRGREIQKKAVVFAFKDADGKRVEDREDVPFSRTIAAGDELEVRYFPGDKKSSRIVGEANLLWPTVFFGSLLAGVVVVVKLAREASA